ncbi:hypothetical protein [Methylobacterium trifolii]|uniref:DUF2157 domain-containing protein n=1 Tax=Methylobacterium trifolii TaxID=1003092 RepID=A0ABQ4U875_9HYPH|nr:hypothetical protein [Methylobacterium trifolii]GJE62030.1 hypothetical protein MPOCJGCO_4158 [Methylobacterium trifolii]
MTPSHPFDAAVAAGIITTDQAARLAAFYGPGPTGQVAVAGSPAATHAVFDLAHVLWYAGALIVIGAMGLFSTVAFAQMGSGALVATALAYAVLFTAAGHYLWRTKGLPVPGGLLVTVAIAMTPLAVFGVQEGLGWWGRFGDPGQYKDFYVWIKGGWLPMEVATLAVALVAVRFYPFGFITMVAAVALWFLSMDLTPWLAGTFDFGWALRSKVSMWFGLVLIALSWTIDLRQRRADYAFWLHLAAIAAFWGGLTSQNSDSEVAKLVYCLINVGLIGLALFLTRRIYAVFGAIGIAFYLGHLAEKIFKDSLLFPFALSLIGIGVVGAGLLYRRHRDRILSAFEHALPAGLRSLRPRHALGPASERSV